MKLRPSYLFQYLTSKHHQNSLAEQKKDQYVMVHIPLTPPESFGFRTHKAHISIYEQYDKKLPHLSLMHFSCYFTTQSDQSYRIHAYFDIQGELMAEPCFAKEIGQNKYTSLAIDACNPEWVAFFAHQAMTSVSHWFNATKHAIYQHLARLDAQYEKLDARSMELSSAPLKRKEYLSSLEALQVLLKQRARYIEDPREANVSIFYTKKLILSLQNAQACEDLLAAETKRAKTKREIPDNAYGVVWTSSSQHKKKKAHQLTPAQEVSSMFIPLVTRFNEFKGLVLDISLLARDFSPFARIERELLLLEDCNISAWTIEDQIQLRQFSVAFDALGLQFLRYVISADPTHPQRAQAMQSLGVFRSMLTVTDYIAAIERQDLPLIMQLIDTHEAFLDAPIKLSVRRTQFPSLMHYCMTLAQQPSMPDWVVPCTKFLMEKGASLLILDSHRLTFLEWILLNSTHPLNSILGDMSMILDLKVYVQLRYTLNEALKVGSFSHQQRVSLQSKVAIYDNVIGILRDNRKLSQVTNQSNLYEATKKFQRILSFDEKMQMLLEPTYMDKMNRLIQLSSVIQRMVPQELLNQTIKSTDYKSIFGIIDVDRLASKSFDEKKEFLSNGLDIGIQQFEALRMMLFGKNLDDPSSQFSGLVGLLGSGVRAMHEIHSMGIFSKQNEASSSPPRVVELESDGSDCDDPDGTLTLTGKKTSS